MEKKTLKQRIKQNPALKKAVHRFIMHPVKTRPNWWIRLFYFVYLKRGKGSVIYRSVRKDLPPFNQFSLGCYSVIMRWETYLLEIIPVSDWEIP